MRAAREPVEEAEQWCSMGETRKRNDKAGSRVLDELEQTDSKQGGWPGGSCNLPRRDSTRA
ncbi:UNVERIFIED_CONTAM: hypothetical protein FKN15_060163 [Acipenser sinensis]